VTEKAEVLRDHVIEVLRSKDVTVTPTSQDPATHSITYIIQKADIIEEQTFPPYVGRRMLHYLQRRFGVAIHLFFTLETIITKPSIVKPPKTA
jgi:hypothetical protein